MKARLVSEPISPRTVEALEHLLESARKGVVVGIAFAVMFRRRRYMVEVAGEAREDPTFARGCVASLDDALSKMIHGKADDLPASSVRLPGR